MENKNKTIKEIDTEKMDRLKKKRKKERDRFFIKLGVIVCVIAVLYLLIGMIPQHGSV